MSSRNTRMLTLRLDIVEDADIIAWLDSFPAGHRSQAIRDVLRDSAPRGRRDEDLSLKSIRSVVAEELDRALARRQISGMEAASQPVDDSEAEQKYGEKLDRMLGGLQARMQDNEDA